MVLLLGLGAGSSAGLSLQELPSSPSWEGLQFLGADAKHRIFVLNGHALEVHRLTTSGLGDGFALEPAAGSEAPAMVLAASMGESSGDWLLRFGAFDVRWFRGREETNLARPPWLVQDLLLSDGNPVAAVAPLRGAFAFGGEEEAPLLIRLSGNDWIRLLDSADDPGGNLGRPDSAAFQAAYRRHRWRITVNLAADSEGRVWIADRHAFRLRELNKSGSLRTVLTLGEEPKMEIVERPSEEREEMIEAAAEAGRKIDADADWLSEQPKKAISGLGVGWDGRTYLVLAGGDWPLLARWDPLRLSFEVVELSETTLPVSSTLDLAAGRDGLYFAERAGDLGRWFVSWEALDSADWQIPEETVYLDGFPLAEIKPPVTGADAR